MNVHGVFLQDIYLLSYCGMKVIFQVCKTYERSVCLIELATKKYKNGISLTKKIQASKNPLIITRNNSYYKSTYEVPTREDKKLIIHITPSDRIYWEAAKYNEYPKMGMFLAVPFPDYLKKYWKKPKKDIDKLKIIN